jgi:hypothetical protein
VGLDSSFIDLILAFLGKFQTDCGFKGFHSYEFISFGIRARFPIRSNSIFFFLAYLILGHHCSRVKKKKKKKKKEKVAAKVHCSRVCVG